MGRAGSSGPWKVLAGGGWGGGVASLKRRYWSWAWRKREKLVGGGRRRFQA